MEGEAAASPRRGGIRVPCHGPHSRSRNPGSDMAGRERRRKQVLGPCQAWEGTAPPALPRPRGGPTGLTWLPAPLAWPRRPFPAAPPATPGPRLAVPPRTPEQDWKQARGLPRTHHCQRRAATYPVLRSSSLRRTPCPRAPSRDLGPRTARDPFLPSLPSPSPTSSRSLSSPYWPEGWCEKGRLGRGFVLHPAAGGGARRCRKVGGAWAVVGFLSPPRCSCRHVMDGCGRRSLREPVPLPGLSL